MRILSDGQSIGSFEILDQHKKRFIARATLIEFAQVERETIVLAIHPKEIC